MEEARPGTLSVAILAGTRLLREELVQVLAQTECVGILGAAASAKELGTRLGDRVPDLVLIEAALPEALRAVPELRASWPGVKVVALAVPDSEAEIVALAESGISGYVLREGSLDDLLREVASVVRGELSSPRIAGMLLRRVAGLGELHAGRAPEHQLSARELEVADLLARGLSNKEIARRLSIELQTVKSHVHSILTKLGLSRRAEIGGWFRGRLP